jgi:hypothetical protein
MFKCTGSKRKTVAMITNTHVNAKTKIRSQQAARHTAAVYASSLLGVLGPGEYMDYFCGEEAALEDFLAEGGKN